MNIYTRLKQDHRKQERLLDQLIETSGDTAERRELWSDLKAELEAHAAAEEQTFYAALIEKPEGQEQARHSVAEHKDMDDLIDELDDLAMDNGAWLQKLETLKDCVMHHVVEEENEVFPDAKELVDSDRADRMSKRFDERKSAEL